MTNFLVVFYSATGNVARLADALVEGAEAEGAEVRLRRVHELAPPEAIASNPAWAEYSPRYHELEVATHDDLEWADGFAFGSPTRFGGITAQLKQLLDTTGPLWARGLLQDKVGTGFSSASTAHGGLESTILALNNVLYHWGALVLPLGYTSDEARALGNPYGATHVSRGGSAPGDVELAAARAQGARLARFAGAVAAVRAG